MWISRTPPAGNLTRSPLHISHPKKSPIMSSNPISECCTVPLRHEGQSSGRMITIEKSELHIPPPILYTDWLIAHAYISEPATTKAIPGCAILCLSDGFGISNNAKLLADRFSAQGFFTVVPDLFEGDAFPDPRPASFDLRAWLNTGATGKGHLPGAVDPIVEGVIRWLRNVKKFDKIGATGYCFGGKVWIFCSLCCCFCSCVLWKL